MGTDPDNSNSVIGLDAVVERQKQRILVALDAMAVTDVKQLVQEIEAKLMNE